MIAKHLIIENGVLKVTDKPMPKSCWPKYCDGKLDYWSQTYLRNVCKCSYELESWKQDAVEVSNPRAIDEIRIEGVYHSPVGIEYKVKEVCYMMGKDKCPEEKPLCPCTKVCTYETVPMKQVAILSFASPKEETPASKEKPDFWKLAEEITSLRDHSKQLTGTVVGGLNEAYDLGFKNASYKYDKQIAALQEEIRQLKNKQ